MDRYVVHADAPEDGSRSDVKHAAPTNPDDLAALLRTLPRNRSLQTREALLALIEELAEPAKIRAIMASIRSDPVRLAAVARRSFRHTNNFDKMVLLEHETGGTYRLTLHLWRPPFTQQEVDDGHIHDHRCDFWSSVLFGGLRSDEFARSETGARYPEVCYRPVRTEAGAKINR